MYFDILEQIAKCSWQILIPKQELKKSDLQCEIRNESEMHFIFSRLLIWLSIL